MQPKVSKIKRNTGHSCLPVSLVNYSEAGSSCGRFGRLSVLALVALASLAGCGGSSDGDVDTGDTAANNIAVESDSVGSDEKRVIRIMAVGDSITHGVPDPGPSASWRLPFTQNMDDDDCVYEMVGSQQTNELHSTFVSAHEAYSAQQAGHFLTGFNNWAGENEGIVTAMQKYTPDVVLLHIGTNDAIREQSNDETVQEIDQIVAAILDGNADVLVANVIPTYANQFFTGVDTRISDLGDKIEAYIAQMANSQVQLVDVRRGFSADLMYPDGVHPNTRGSQFMADAFYAVYKANGYCE